MPPEHPHLCEHWSSGLAPQSTDGRPNLRNQICAGTHLFLVENSPAYCAVPWFLPAFGMMYFVRTPATIVGNFQLSRLRQSRYLRHSPRSIRYHARAVAEPEASTDETQRSQGTGVPRESSNEKEDDCQTPSTNTDRSRDSRGLLWGSSARRGVVDKRKKLSAKEKSASGGIQATKANNIDYGSIADGVERWYLLQVQPLRENAAQRVINSLNKKRLNSTGEYAKVRKCNSMVSCTSAAKVACQDSSSPFLAYFCRCLCVLKKLRSTNDYRLSEMITMASIQQSPSAECGM